jgi:uncharacterized Tic20 family protein
VIECNFAEAYAKEALNFQIFTVLLGVVVVLIGVLTLGLAFLIALRCSSRR